MRTRLFLLFAFAAVTVLSNVAVAGNIVPSGVRVVVIDAGHGGRFPGAHYAGVYEKTLTLNVALKLGKLIETEMPGVKVVYTRTTDKALDEVLANDLQKRADIANGCDGELFLSIHVNAARSTSAKGVETLIMGESSKEQRYNEEALYENNREELVDMSDARTAAIVRAMIQNKQFTYGEHSMAFARYLQTSYSKAGRVMRGIKPQLLRVLYATDMPCVLTEIGFMSNPQEMAYMKSEKGQNEIARTLFNAVQDYSDHLVRIRQAEADGVRDTTAETAPAVQPGVKEETPEAVTTPATPAPKTEPKPAVETPQAVQPEQPAEQAAAKPAVRYAVQVLASPKVVALNAADFKSYRGKVKQYTSDGKFRYKYCVGECDDAAAIQKTLREVRRIFPQAFVVRCKGTQIVK